MKSYEFFGIYDFTEIAEELTTEELFLVNGGDCGAGSACASRVKQSCTGIPSCTKDTPPGCGNNPPPSNPMCGTNPPPKNPLCPGGFNDDHKYKDGEDTLQENADEKTRLSELINTDNLAKIIADNLDSLDPATRDYLKSLGENGAEERIKQILNGVDVYTGIDETTKQEAFKNVDNLKVSTEWDGLTLGNDIYLVDGKNDLKNQNNEIDASIADILGHEAIHTLQAYVEGEESFIEYCATHEYDGNNDYEAAAYQFGGNINKFDKKGNLDLEEIDNSNQILEQYKNWWKK